MKIMGESKKEFPYEIKNVDEKLANELMKYFTEGDYRYIRVGPKGYILLERFAKEALDIYTMPLRPTDVFVNSFPRSGTTWTQELVWLVVNDLDYDKSKAIPLTERYTFIDYSMFTTPAIEAQILEKNAGCVAKMKLAMEILKPGVETAKGSASPRFIKFHLPPSLLPRSLLDTAKLVYVARDPRDVAVSNYHFFKNATLSELVYIGDFNTFWDSFMKDLHLWTPFFEHVKEAWELRHHPNMLFLFGEELSQDLPGVVKRVAKFFNKEYTDEQISQLCDHLGIDNFKKNASVDFGALREIGAPMPTKETFIRKGKVGGWRDYFDEEMTREAERWLEENTRGTDFRFPTQ